ncbi:DNA topoisomerase IV subunit A [Candidatus Woesearchaeota archaeon]|jgi:DNA topoisomerase VI subunit A|nr:DNA topoisomerase IV subunit A [Candidatus Woesearchaeota archaeon]
MAELTKKDIVKRLNALGAELKKNIDDSKDPKLTIPLRTLANAYFDKNARMIKLGDKTQTRTFFNVGQSKKFMQTSLVAAQIKKLLEQDKPAISTRQLYYILKHSIEGTKENTFDDQATESDPVIEDVEVTINALREQLGLEATPSGVISGPLMYEDLKTDDIIDCSKMGSAGAAIPPNTEPHVVKFKQCTADFILIVEKFAVWNLLNQSKFWKKNNCILMTGKGQAARSDRRLVSRLAKEYKIPVYVFCDNDAYGYYIYSVYKQGSINLAFFSEKAACPDAKFIGLKTGDIAKFKIAKSNWIKLEGHDLKRLKEISKYEWFQSKGWQAELKAMKDFGYKVESDALVSKSIEFMGDTYLPRVIKEKNWLD